jgi:hypothetical protein
MFLDDKLYGIAKSVNYTSWHHKTDVKKAMYLAVIAHIVTNNKKIVTDKSGTDEDLFLLIKRTKRHWYNTLTKLEKEDIKLFEPLERCSFENLIAHHPLFKNFSDAILAYIK